MQLNEIFAFIIAFALASVCSYIDLDTFFSGRKLDPTITCTYLPSLVFLVINGMLSVLILGWTYDNTFPLAEIRSNKDVVQRAIIIAFSVPLLVRSKLFSSGQDKLSYGPALIYDFYRDKVLFSLNKELNKQRELLVTKNCARITAANHPNFPEILRDWVNSMLSQFDRNASDAARKDEYNSIQQRFATAQMSGLHVQVLLRWAADCVGVLALREWLAEYLPKDT